MYKRQVHAKLDREANTITIDADGINEVNIYLSDALLDLSKPVRFVTNGSEVTELIPRSRRQFLNMAYGAQIDAGEVFVARWTGVVPDKATSSK